MADSNICHICDKVVRDGTGMSWWGSGFYLVHEKRCYPLLRRYLDSGHSQDERIRLARADYRRQQRTTPK